MTDLIKCDDALLPCPFCKCEEVTTWLDREQGEKWGYASCDGCAARGPEVRTNWDREHDAPWHSEAIAAWNTRALPAIDPAAIREAALREAMDACTYVIKNIDILKADGETYETIRIQKIARGLVDVSRQQIEALIGEKK